MQLSESEENILREYNRTRKQNNSSASQIFDRKVKTNDDLFEFECVNNTAQPTTTTATVAATRSYANLTPSNDYNHSLNTSNNLHLQHSDKQQLLFGGGNQSNIQNQSCIGGFGGDRSRNDSYSVKCVFELHHDDDEDYNKQSQILNCSNSILHAGNSTFINNFNRTNNSYLAQYEDNNNNNNNPSICAQQTNNSSMRLLAPSQKQQQQSLRFAEEAYHQVNPFTTTTMTTQSNQAGQFQDQSINNNNNNNNLQTYLNQNSKEQQQDSNNHNQQQQQQKSLNSYSLYQQQKRASQLMQLSGGAYSRISGEPASQQSQINMRSSSVQNTGEFQACGNNSFSNNNYYNNNMSQISHEDSGNIQRLFAGLSTNSFHPFLESSDGLRQPLQNDQQSIKSISRKGSTKMVRDDRRTSKSRGATSTNAINNHKSSSIEIQKMNSKRSNSISNRNSQSNSNKNSKTKRSNPKENQKIITKDFESTTQVSTILNHFNQQSRLKIIGLEKCEQMYGNENLQNVLLVNIDNQPNQQQQQQQQQPRKLLYKTSAQSNRSKSNNFANVTPFVSAPQFPDQKPSNIPKNNSLQTTISNGGGTLNGQISNDSTIRSYGKFPKNEILLSNKNTIDTQKEDQQGKIKDNNVYIQDDFQNSERVKFSHNPIENNQMLDGMRSTTGRSKGKSFASSHATTAIGLSSANTIMMSLRTNNTTRDHTPSGNQTSDIQHLPSTHRNTHPQVQQFQVSKSTASITQNQSKGRETRTTLQELHYDSQNGTMSRKRSTGSKNECLNHSEKQVKFEKVKRNFPPRSIRTHSTQRSRSKELLQKLKVETSNEGYVSYLLESHAASCSNFRKELHNQFSLSTYTKHSNLI